MNLRTPSLLGRGALSSALLLLAASAANAGNAPGAKATATDPNRSDATAPVAQPETDPAMSNSGALVPSQPIRPEGTEESTVPKTPMDKAAANSADVGTAKKNDKTMRPGSGGDGSTSPTR